jgi:hypothetical protein
VVRNLQGYGADPATGAAPPLIWPSALARSAPPPQLVYLDLNHWIALAKAAAGHPDGRAHVGALDACRAARADRAAVFPLSATHYMELLKIKDPAQRGSIAQVMEELSGFATLLPRDLISRLEIESVLDQRFGPAARPLLPIPLIGRGSAWAFGRNGSLKIRRGQEDVTDEIRRQWGTEHFDNWRAQAELHLERSVLVGPSDTAVPALRTQYGWRPEVALEINERRAIQEQEQTRRLDSMPEWRRGRLRDVVAVREMIIELFEAIQQAASERGLDTDALFTGRDDVRAFARGMPSTEVAIEMKTAAHRNRDKAWRTNDILDIDALAVAVPYCDVVVTEKHAHHVLTTAGLHHRMGTALCRRLSQLEAHFLA